MDDQNRPDQPTEAPLDPIPSGEASPAPAPAPFAAQPTAPYGQPQAPGQPGVPTIPQPQASGQPVAPGQQPYQYYQPAPVGVSGKATGALVCGILAILLSWMPLFGLVLGIVAIVLAGKAVKEAGKNGKTTGGKVCGIAGIVLSVLAFILYIALGIGAALFIAANSDGSLYSGSSSSLSDAPAAATTAESSELEAAAVIELDKLKAKDAAVLQKLSADLDMGLADATGYSLTDLGVDPISFAEWMLADFDYQLDGSYDYEDGTGVVYADVTVRDSMAFATTFMEDAQAGIDSGDLEAVDEAGAKALLGEVYKSAMEKSTATTTDIVSIDLVKQGDSWQVDQDSWTSELDYLFGLY